jgi:hypothetical protein
LAETEKSENLKGRQELPVSTAKSILKTSLIECESLNRKGWENVDGSEADCGSADEA